MTCSIVQADLGPLFADVDADLVALIITTATGIVLGPSDGQATTEGAQIACGVDPCLAIKLLSQHLISTLPGSESEGATVTSERVGEVSTSYANAGSASGLYAGSTYGAMYAMLLAQYEKCKARRRTFPRSVGPSGRCGC